MNGFNKPRTEQLPADSSGIINMSSPSGSSDSGSSASLPLVETLHSGVGLGSATNGGKGMARDMLMKMSTKVQNQTSYNNTSNNKTVSPTKNFMKSPSMGKPAAMNQNMNQNIVASEAARQKNTDKIFLRFQAQMSQMKSAMDAVQNEILLHSTKANRAPQITNPPLPIAPVPNRRGRKSAAFLLALQQQQQSASGATTVPIVSPSGSAPVGSVRYQSQISTANGLKMKIKKSPRQVKRKGAPVKVKGKRGRAKKRKGDDDDDDDDDDDLSDVDNNKSTKNSQTGTLLDDNESADLGCGWGDALPENVLIKILSYAVKYEEGCIPILVRASKVCRLWWKAASKPELWTSVDLSSSMVKDKFKIERNLMYFLENRFNRVKHLNIGGWSSALTSPAIDVLVRCCKDLESIGLSSCQKLTAQNLKTITEFCGSLKKLDLSAISTTYNTKTAVSPTAIGDAAEAMGARLTHISLANNCLANCAQIVGSLADNCVNLQALDLSNVTSPRRDSIAINIEHLQQGCQNLKILRLTNSDFFLSETSLKEQVSSPGFPNLEELSIAVDPKRCQGMDEGDIERILKHANKLRLLDVRGCSRIGDSGLVRINAWNLEHLYLSGCYATKSSNDGLELVARKWRHSFKEIDFSWTPGEETINSAMKALAELDDDKTIPPLKVLDLCGSSVSFDSVKVALRTCEYLERLNLTSCRALPRGIKRNYQSAQEISTLREQVLSGKFDDHPDD